MARAQYEWITHKKHPGDTYFSPNSVATLRVLTVGVKAWWSFEMVSYLCNPLGTSPQIARVVAWCPFWWSRRSCAEILTREILFIESLRRVIFARESSDRDPCAETLLRSCSEILPIGLLQTGNSSGRDGNTRYLLKLAVQALYTLYKISRQDLC